MTRHRNKPVADTRSAPSAGTFHPEPAPAKPPLPYADRAWEATFDSIRNPVMLLDHEFRILRANAATQEFLKLPPDRIIGQRCSILVHGTRECVDGCPMRVACDSRKHEEAEVYDEKRALWLHVSVDPILDAAGAMVGVIHVIRDITAVKHAEHEMRRLNAELEDRVLARTRELRQSEARYERIAATVPGVLYDYIRHPDGTSRFLYLSPRCRDIFETESEVLLQDMARCWNMVHPDDIARLRQADDEAARERTSFDVEVRVITPSGRLKWIQIAAQANPAPPDEPPVWTGFISDVTARKQAEETVRTLCDELETRVRERTADLEKALDEVRQLKEALQQENAHLRETVEGLHRHDPIVAESAAMRQVLARAQQVARTGSTVLLLGETGTGKELLATFIHRQSDRQDRAMVSVNCAAIPAALVESELFGREKGAYTGALSRQIGSFELAHNSTLFLDEIGELPLEVQAKLLRALQTRQVQRLGNPKPIDVDVRVIAATNKDLGEAIQHGRFRQDLYYRLNVFPIEVPPLRKRPDDIPILAWTFVNEFAQTFNRNIESIARQSMDALLRHPWPGNIRELRNVIERSMILATGPKLRIDLPGPATPATSTTSRSMKDVEKDHVLAILNQTAWRVRGKHGAAQILGLKPTTLETRMQKLGIHRPRKTSAIP